MGRFKSFTEERRKDGTYVSCDYDLLTAEKLATWCVENLIPQPLSADKYHSTLLYSRKPVPTAQEIVDKVDKEIELQPVGFKMFDSKEDPSFKALVIELKAPQLIALHEKLIAAGGTHDYDDYTPHVTVSYNAPRDLDVSMLKLPNFKVKIKGFKVEPLNLNWKD